MVLFHIGNQVPPRRCLLPKGNVIQHLNQRDLLMGGGNVICSLAPDGTPAYDHVPLARNGLPFKHIVGGDYIRQADAWDFGRDNGFCPCGNNDYIRVLFLYQFLRGFHFIMHGYAKLLKLPHLPADKPCNLPLARRHGAKPELAAGPSPLLIYLYLVACLCRLYRGFGSRRVCTDNHHLLRGIRLYFLIIDFAVSVRD